jgi:hypothetical protein
MPTGSTVEEPSTEMVQSILDEAFTMIDHDDCEEK